MGTIGRGALQAFINVCVSSSPSYAFAIKINGHGLLDRGPQFVLQVLDELSYPARTVIVVTVTDKDVVFVTSDQRRHTWIIV
jgi:hypothetical protein